MSGIACIPRARLFFTFYLTKRVWHGNFIFHLLHQVAERGREGMKRAPFPGERGPKGGEGPRQGEAVATDAEWNCSRRKEGRYQQRKSSAEITALMTNKEERS